MTREITDKRQLVQWLQDGCKPEAAPLLIGAENEKIVFRKDTLEPPAYDGPAGIGALLQGFEKFGWVRENVEGEKVTGLKRGGASISIEPSGFLELSGTPAMNVHQIAAELDQHIREAVEIGDGLGLGFLALGFHPLFSADHMPHMPSERAENMLGAMRRNKDLSIHIPMQTAAAQISLDYTSEEDMRQKLRVSLSLQPVVSAVFANSPFVEGAPSGYLSYRSHVSHNSFGGRYGFMLPVAFESGFGFERYVDYALALPLLGVFRGQHYVDVPRAPFASYLNGKDHAAAGQPVTMNDWVDHLSSIWPEVRLRRSLEMRGADSGSPEMLKALAAFWAGLLYDKASLDQAWQMVKDWTAEDREYLRGQTPQTGLQTPFLGTTVQEFARNALMLSYQGLKNRAQKLPGGVDETAYLRPLLEIVQSGVAPAQKLLKAYAGSWQGDVKKVFEAARYKAPRRRNALLPSS